MARKHSGKGSEDPRSDYSQAYSEQEFWGKAKWVAKKAGAEVVHKALQLYYVLQKDEVPKKAKAIVIAALGYFIMPADVIPDLVPLLGFTDDIALMVAALAIVGRYIDDEVKGQALAKMKEWFGKDFTLDA